MKTPQVLFAITAVFLVSNFVWGQSVSTVITKATDTKIAPSQPKVGTSRPVVLDRLDLDASRITGTREQPKVTTILGWKGANPELSGIPVFKTLVNEALLPIDRDVFLRETLYFTSLRNAASKAGNSGQLPPPAK